ncbi:AAA domain-containing protein [Trichoderma sp. SZMC 28015]
MNRADLYCVWGNTLSPCFLFGDPKQLPPTVLTPHDKDAAENYVNRFVKSGDLPALLVLQASGIPTYRLTTQLRMGCGLFDMVSGIIYKGVPHVYAASLSDGLSCPEGKLLPVFIHAPGSRVHTDDAIGSNRCADQVTTALDFMVDLVKSKNIDPSKIGIISPYAANVELLDRMLRKKVAYEALEGIPPASTVDSFQGQENDIIFVVMGTAYPRPRPGFTS